MLKNLAACFVIAYCISLPTLAQSKKAISSHSLLVFPKGNLLKFHPYTFVLDPSFHGYLTFNDRRLDVSEPNKFHLHAWVNGVLNVYDTQNHKKSLLQSMKLRFVDPVYNVLLCGKYSGDTIDLAKVAYLAPEATIYNVDFDVRFKVKEVVLSYYQNGKLQSTKFTSLYASDDILNNIKESGSEILIMKITFYPGSDDEVTYHCIYHLKR